MSVREGGVVKPLGQPDCKKSVLFDDFLKNYKKMPSTQIAMLNYHIFRPLALWIIFRRPEGSLAGKESRVSTIDMTNQQVIIESIPYDML